MKNKEDVILSPYTREKIEKRKLNYDSVKYNHCKTKLQEFQRGTEK